MNLSYTIPNAEENIISGIKKHTLRTDRKKRWRKGMLIHHSYSFRSKGGYKCFHKNHCKSVQEVLIVLESGSAKLPDWQKKLFAKYRNEIQVHSNGKLFYKLDRLFPNEHPQSKEHRIISFEPITKGSFWKGVNNVEEGSSIVNYSIHITVDRKRLTPADMVILARNDGFNNLGEFVDYFFKIHGTKRKPEMWAGRIIHWTDLKY